MRRAVGAAMGLLLLILGTHGALAQYTGAGPLNLSTSQPAAGGTVTVSGTGFAIDSNVYVTFESAPLLLATATADASGAFSVGVTIPYSASGQHTLVATGLDPQGSARVLTSTIHVLSATTQPVPRSSAPTSVILAIAAAGIVLLAGVALLLLRREPGR
jgi:hypothetical protein